MNYTKGTRIIFFIFAGFAGSAFRISADCQTNKDPYPKGIPSGQDDMLKLRDGHGMPCPYFVSLSLCYSVTIFKLCASVPLPLCACTQGLRYLGVQEL
jgi:hypothetical protein